MTFRDFWELLARTWKIKIPKLHFETFGNFWNVIVGVLVTFVGDVQFSKSLQKLAKSLEVSLNIWPRLQKFPKAPTSNLPKAINE